MKRCGKCKELKALDAFAKNASRRDGLQNQCRACKKVTDAKHHSENKEKQRVRNKVNARKARTYVWKIKSNPCVDCGQTFHPFAMDFDHVRGEKKRDISLLVQRAAAVATLDEEISKCDLVCATCHRLRTWERHNGQFETEDLI